MTHRIMLTLATLAGLVLAGCGRSTAPLQATGGGNSTSDDAQVASALAQSPEYVNEDVYQSDQSQSIDQGGGFAAIRPLAFRRNITDVQSTVDTQYGNPDPNGRPQSALVTIHRRLLGTFDILAGSATPEDTTRTLVRKPLEDLWTRRLALVRVPDPLDTSATRWRVAGTSGVDVRTRDGSTRVLSLRIQSETLDTTITEPLELHRIRRVLRLPEGSEVKLTATTGSASDVVLFYGRDMRRRFVNNGDGTHTFTYLTGRFPGLRHFGVDALSHDTLFDDAAPYDSNAWMLEYAVQPQAVPIGG
jgi:hypothetical protein